MLVGERERGRRALGTDETWVFSTQGNPGLTVSYAVRWSHGISSRIFTIREAAEFTMSRRGPSSWVTWVALLASCRACHEELSAPWTETEFQCLLKFCAAQGLGFLGSFPGGEAQAWCVP